MGLFEKYNLTGFNTPFLGISWEKNNKTFVENYQPQYVAILINDLKNHFVQTSLYTKAIDNLNSSNAIMITGFSGMGKTSMSIMVANYFIEKEKYKYRFISSQKENDIQNICDLMDQHSNFKEVIIFDDIFGSTEFIKSEEYFAKLKLLFEKMLLYKNKKFIANSRNTIFQSAKGCNEKIGIMMEKTFKFINLIDTDKESKIKIFVNYIHKNNIDKLLLDLIIQKKLDNNFISQIIDHPNFTPLIMDIATKRCQEKIWEKNIIDFKSIFIDALNNPKDIWESEIKALDQPSKQYINIFYSLSDNLVNRKIVDNCYINYLKQLHRFPNVSLDDIHNRINALIVYDDNSINFINPSIKEYLAKKITLAEKEDIIKSAIYLEQIEKLDLTKIYLEKLMVLGKERELPLIFNLKVLPKSYNLNGNKSLIFTDNISMQFLKYLYEFKIEDKNYEQLVIEVLENVLKDVTSLFFLNSHIVLDTFKLNYDFTSILDNKGYVEELYKNANYENIWNLISLTEKKDDKGFNYLGMTDYVKFNIIQALQYIGEEKLISLFEDNIDDYISDELDYYEKDEEVDVDNIIENVNDAILMKLNYEEANNVILDIIGKHNIYNFDINEIDNLVYSQYIYDTIETAVNAYLES